ncbi:MAG: hypothetical protein Q4D02_00150 [Clostridia bacterium]|nr:hypothetical protein [Clostridia bacterium]
MQIVGLMGYVDKHDFIMNMAKVIEIMGKSVLVIDGTYDQKLKYTVPAIDATSKCYITKYSDIDFAVGFSSYFELEEYMREHDVDITRYDYVIMDIDCAEMYRKFNDKEFNRKYMFIDSTVLSVAKNKDLVKAIRENMQDGEIKFTKILYKAYLSRASENYLESQIALYNISWQEENYEIIVDEQDRIVSIDSQLSGMIQVRKHTKVYVMTLAEIVSKLLDEDVKFIVKQIKRRRN